MIDKENHVNRYWGQPLNQLVIQAKLKKYLIA